MTKKPPTISDSSEDQTMISPIQQIVEAASARQPALLMISGPHLGRSFEIDKEEFMIGRIENCDLQIEDDLASRHHCKILLTPDGAQIVDLASTNGTLVNGRRVDRAFLKEGDQIQVGSLTLFKYHIQGEAEAKFLAQLFTAATKDFLTGAYGKKFLLDRLSAEYHYLIRRGGNLTVMALDLDHFKLVNDTFGHLAGDDALKAVAKHLINHTRKDDVVARFGGEEFVILMRDINLEQAKQIAENLREGISKIKLSAPSGQDFQVRVSIGVCSLSTANRASFTTPESLIQHADEKLYEAKRSGRNKVCA